MIEKKPHSFLQRIFELRKARGVTLKELGKVCKVGESGASSIENGDAPLRAECIPEIAKLLKVEIWELFQDYGTSGNEPLNEEARNMVGLWRKLNEADKDTILNLLLSLGKVGPTKAIPKKGELKKSA